MLRFLSSENRCSGETCNELPLWEHPRQLLPYFLLICHARLHKYELSRNIQPHQMPEIDECICQSKKTNYAMLDSARTFITLSKNENGNDLANGKRTLIAIQNYSLPRRDRETGQ